MAAVPGRQHVLQDALAMGLSATEGFHGEKPNWVSEAASDFNGQEYILPESFRPKPTDRFKIRSKSGDIEASYIAIGAWPWGDAATWDYKPEERQNITDAWKTLFDSGVNYIDTAQAYGSGDSERICGELVKDIPRDKYVMQTKWYVVADNLTNLLHPQDAPRQFLVESLERMKLEYVDVYMVHGHIHASSIKQVAAGLADCVEKGLTKAVAVANYSKEDMVQMSDELAKYGIPLAMNQIEYHMLRRLPEVDGLMKACREHNIAMQSYSSLAQGRLSGKYTEDNLPPKERRFSSYPMKELEKPLATLRRIAERHGVSMPGAALNYNIGKGVIPVVGIRSVAQAKSNLEAFGWRLSDEEYKELDSVSILGKYTRLWQQG